MCKMRLDIRSGHRRPEERHSPGHSVREPSRRLALPGLQATEVHVLPDRIERGLFLSKNDFGSRPYKAACHNIMTGCFFNLYVNKRKFARNQRQHYVKNNIFLKIVINLLFHTEQIA